MTGAVPGVYGPDQTSAVDGTARRLGAFLCPEGGWESFVIPGTPNSKARPRFGRGGRVFAPDQTTERETRLRLTVARRGRKPEEGGIAIGAVFYRPNRQRIDVDNLLKHLLDAANGVLWIDDVQVAAVLGEVELDVEKPRTLVVLGPRRSTLLRGSDDVLVCEACGTSYRRPPGTKATRRFCSYDCSRTARGGVDLSEPVGCEVCLLPFRRKTTGQKLCSEACRATQQRDRNRDAAHGNACQDCAQPLAKRTAARCRSCWLIARAEGKA